MAIVGVVPAAGSGSRLQPLAGSKEALVIGGRPLIGYLLERLAVAGVDRVRVVIRPAKHDLVELVARLGHEIVSAEPPTISASLLAGLAGLDRDDVVLFGFPDSVWGPVDGFVPLRRRVEAGDAMALGLFRSDEPERSDVVQVDRLDRVVGIEIKPRRPRSDWIWGCLAARAGALDGLRPDDELSDFVAACARLTPVPTVRLGRIVDVGTRESLASAETHPLVTGAPGSGT